MNREEIAQAVVDNVKTGKWLSCTFTLEHPNAPGGELSVGVKAFGRWVQRIECAGLIDGLPEYKTNKALKAGVVGLLDSLTRHLGAA